ncbi:MAG TPA: DNA-binding protein [Candidatus Thermoplasmatota archaeon]|nr:DNA-binding protein [Candidatus Thermoplasmatota archaeon]
MADDELEELRRRKMAEMQNQAGAEAHQEAQRAQAEAAKANVLRVILTPEARERLTRVKLAYPDVATSLENQLIVLYQQGRIRGQIDEELLKQFLARVTPKKRDINIERR